MAYRNFEDAIKWTKLSHVPLAVRWRLAQHLDSHCSAANWKGLADENGLCYLDIQSIENRVCHTFHKSCTLMLFEERFDQTDLTVEDLVTSLSAIKNEACISVLKNAFHEGLIHSAVQQEVHLENGSPTPLSPILSCNGNEIQKQLKKVFITYSKDSIKEARKIYNWLRKISCIGILDIYDHLQLFENRLDWYNEKYLEADYILLLVSPQYDLDIRKKGTSETSQTACYINSRMQAEYMKNLCKNKRFIPVVLPGALSEHVPAWLQYNTIIYHWPHHAEYIYSRIQDLPRPSFSLMRRTPVVRCSRM